MIIPENEEIELNDEIGTCVTLKRGEIGFVMASTSQVEMCSKKTVSL